MDMDNLNGESKELNSAGDIYAVSSGRGVAHMEKTASEGANRLIQTILQIPQDKLQYEPEHYKIKEANLPVMILNGGHLKVCIGKVGDMESPAKLKALPRFVIGRVKVDAGATVDIPLDEDLEHGFLYVIEGEGQVSACDIKQGDGAHVFGPGKVLSIQNKDDSKPMDIFMVASKPLNEPWVKLLGFNGFILAKDEEDANRVMAKVGEVGVENFSYKVL
jgi:redox-sensitive bicupin YhaK (pirin superfamily)